MLFRSAILQGTRVGLLTNHTGLARDGQTTIDLLYAAAGVELVALFSPEHGIRGRSEERRVGKECRSRWSPYH